jgi:glutaminase
LFKKGVDMNMQDYDGRTALHVAAAEWNMEAVKYLIEKCNCNTNITDR